jgi:hypothetical protein
MAGVGGAAVPGRLSLAGTEARPTELFSYKPAIKRLFFVILSAAKDLVFLRFFGRFAPSE